VDAPAAALGLHEAREHIERRGFLDDLVDIERPGDVAQLRLQQL
jgi:hypothetical protein